MLIESQFGRDFRPVVDANPAGCIPAPVHGTSFQVVISLLPVVVSTACDRVRITDRCTDLRQPAERCSPVAIVAVRAIC